MPKIQKTAEFLNDLRAIIMQKQAEGPTATGKPGADTHPVSLGAEHDKVDKNSQGRPEKNPQHVGQKPSTDSSEPAKAKHAEEAVVAVKEAQATTSVMPDTAPAPEAKAAPSKVEQKVAEEATPATHENLAKLGADLLKAIDQLNKQAEGPTATGKPGADTHPVSLGAEHDKVDKNSQGRPEKNPQHVGQKPSTDSSEPAKAKHAASDEEISKIASAELGRQFARAMLKQAQEAAAADQVKTAGRRDFEQLIAQAAAELEEQQAEKQGAALFDEMFAGQSQASNQEKQAAQAESQAEAEGAKAFDELYKVAQYEYALTVAKQTEEALNAKLAEEAAKSATLAKQAAEVLAKLTEKEAQYNEKIASEKRAQEWSQWSQITVDGVVDRLRREATSRQ